ncbi:uncharacterized protein LOC106635700 [Copidosoma floridanum]|uniref:uncharacterized protein LOC106635700 n=1 Tax=Copidosoma floridanum TaxID=29053 RepID=UPI0006C9B92B|nr:uncharacterized protein LOC106635700 [Copidosoma floridanum]
MPRSAFVGAVAVLLVALAAVDAAPKSSCLKSKLDCVHSTDCCSGCCSENKCVEYAESCQRDLAKLGAGKGGPCASLDPPCKPSYTCVLQQALCSNSPCKPVPTCVPPDYHDYD